MEEKLPHHGRHLHEADDGGRTPSHLDGEEDFLSLKLIVDDLLILASLLDADLNLVVGSLRLTADQTMAEM